MNEELYKQGLEIRRAVLGKDYVDKALAGADDFSRPMQELSTEYCWGRVWSRPGPKRRDRKRPEQDLLLQDSGVERLRTEPLRQHGVGAADRRHDALGAGQSAGHERAALGDAHLDRPDHVQVGVDIQLPLSRRRQRRHLHAAGRPEPGAHQIPRLAL